MLVSDSLLHKLEPRKFYIKGTRTVRLAKSRDKANDYHCSTVVDFSFESTVVLLDTGTPGASREIFSEDADGEMAIDVGEMAIDVGEMTIDVGEMAIDVGKHAVDYVKQSCRTFRMDQ